MALLSRESLFGYAVSGDYRQTLLGSLLTQYLRGKPLVWCTLEIYSRVKAKYPVKSSRPATTHASPTKPGGTGEGSFPRARRQRARLAGGGQKTELPPVLLWPPPDPGETTPLPVSPMAGGIESALTPPETTEKDEDTDETHIAEADTAEPTGYRIK